MASGLSAEVIKPHVRATDPHPQYLLRTDYQTIAAAVEASNTHSSDRNNPHHVTAAQIGTMSTAQIQAYVALNYYTKVQIDASFAALYHGHTVAQITDLFDNVYSEEEVDSYLSGKSDTGHSHVVADITDLYDNVYSESEVDAFLSTLSDDLDDVVAAQDVINDDIEDRVTTLEGGGGGSGLTETPFTLTDGASIAVDLSESKNYEVMLEGNRELATPTNITAGQRGIIAVAQDTTGSRTLSFAAGWEPPADGITLTTDVEAIDLLGYYCTDSGTVAVWMEASGAVLLADPWEARYIRYTLTDMTSAGGSNGEVYTPTEIKILESSVALTGLTLSDVTAGPDASVSSGWPGTNGVYLFDGTTGTIISSMLRGDTDTVGEDLNDSQFTIDLGGVETFDEIRWYTGYSARGYGLHTVHTSTDGVEWVLLGTFDTAGESASSPFTVTKP